MNIQANKQQAFSLFDLSMATFATGSTFSLLEKEAPKKKHDYFEYEKYVGLSRFDNLRSKIERFVHLQPNWDSYDADAISKSAIDKATEALGDLYTNGFLSGGIFVHVFPMRDGGIQFEFDGENICAELEISPDKKLLFILFNEKGKILFEKNILELSELSTLLEEAPQYD